MDESDRVTAELTVHGLTAGSIRINPAITGGTFTDVGHTTAPVTFLNFAQTRAILTFDIPDDDTPEADQTITIAISDITITAPTTPPGPWTAGDPGSATFTIRANDGYVAPVVTPAPGPVADDSAARAARLEAPLAAVARGVGVLAAEVVSRRVNGSSSLGFWASSGYVSADGEHEGITYDGNTAALHLGLDTQWRDDLIGVSIAHSNGDMDFNNTDNLETTVTSVHPYLTRPFNGAQLWTTIGYGTGDAELKEPDATIKTDVKVLTGAFGITHEQSDLLTATIGALLSRARLDSATGDNKTLPAVTVSTLRVTAGAEAGWSHGAWRPFLTVHLRHDAGDGEDGGAADLGGGVEWQTGSAHVRLEGAGHVQGNGPDENRLSLTASKTAGRLNLGLTVTANDGIDTANLLTGKWRF